MHTLSLFPNLLTFGLFAPFLIRIAVSLFILKLGKNRYKKEYNWLSIIYIAAGILVFVGLYTQVVALVAIVVLKLDYYLTYWKNRSVAPITDHVKFLYIISVAVLLSLVFTGPGFLAIDLPL